MKLLFTGKGGKSGSWAVRGEQLGAALGATVKPLATEQDIRDADLTVVVKRTPASVLSALRSSGARWVYDAVDCYPQPLAATWSRAEAIAWMRRRLTDLAPTAVIWPNAKMREDCDIGLPGLTLPHHCRPGLQKNPIRDEIKLVGYEGRAEYLAQWDRVIRAGCASRGWEFVVNPPQLADVDVVVAFRGGEWDGYATRSWKSAVKLANAHGSGTPFIGQRESGYQENATGAEYWADSAYELRISFNWLGSQTAREHISDRYLKAVFTVDQAAAKLREFLGTLA